MRHYKKGRLLAALGQLYEVHRYAEEQETQAGTMKTKKEQQCAEEQREALSECQKIAIAVGNGVEDALGEGSQTVRCLEQYCEMLYQIASGVSPPVVNRQQRYLQLDEKLRQAEQYLKKEIQEEIVAVFLPYKASMWDSLESVWQAAKEDENCTAYVIPIPYFDKNKDGSLGERHYEGDQYPSDIPITPYQEFSLEAVHPDMIFIHNPYDQFNTITTVDPAFYAKKLKKYTDKLVYIPYFVADTDVPTHLCVLPGTLFSDYVIVENENIKQTYIKEYKKMTGRQDGEKKFLALGSPKYDKVLNTKKEDIEIPPEWQEKIAGKKVVLYNTTVSVLLNEPEKGMEKMKWVFKFFEGNPNTVLLWRPHPLSLQTLQSQNLELAEAYQELVKNYRESGLGIYDDTPDLERAIVLSDAYYGDGGSVWALYKKTGKPMMLQNREVVE